MIAATYGAPPDPHEQRDPNLPDGALTYAEYVQYVAEPGEFNAAVRCWLDKYGALTVPVCAYSKHLRCYFFASGNWCDQLFLKALSHLWGVKLTVVQAKSLTELRFNHDCPLEECEIALIYNQDPVLGHYSAACEYKLYMSYYGLR